MRSFIIHSSIFAAAVSASPLLKRATSATDAANMPASVTMSGSGSMSMMSSMSATSMSMSMTSMPSMSTMSSMMMSGMSYGMSMSASTTAGSSNNLTAAELLYPCPEGYLLTYVKTQESYNASLDEVLAIGADFQNATWMYWLSGEGGNDVGATRYVADQGGARSEVLSQYLMNEENVAVQLVMNHTGGPFSTPNGAMLSNYSTVFQIYDNTTASMDGHNVTTAKLFCNFCANSTTLGMEAVLSSLNMALSNIETILMGGMVTYPSPNTNPLASMNTTSSPSSTIMSSTMVMTDATDLPHPPAI